MPVRSTMSDLISLVRTMIADPSGASQQFTDQQVQDALDREGREEVRFEPLTLAPSIVNTASTGNIPSTIFADFYSQYGFWEADVVLQGYVNGASWIVLTPLGSELLLSQAHWWFENNVFTSGTVPGQLPPCFATGKSFDCNAAAASLLEFWASTYARRFSFASDGQSFQITQARDGLLQQAMYYRRRSKPRIATVTRSDVNPPLSAHAVHLLDSGDVFKGV